MVQYVVMEALLFDSEDKESIKPINDHFTKNNWGQLEYVLQFKTLPGRGGDGGRNDVVFKWSGTSENMGRFSVGRFVMGPNAPHWLEDYIDNNRPIIPISVLEKLNEMKGW